MRDSDDRNLVYSTLEDVLVIIKELTAANTVIVGDSLPFHLVKKCLCGFSPLSFFFVLTSVFMLNLKNNILKSRELMEEILTLIDKL